MSKSSQKTKSYRVWNIKALFVLFLPLAITYGIYVYNDISWIGMFLMASGFTLFGLHGLIRKPWLTKIVHEIWNYKREDDGSEFVEYADSDSEDAVKFKVTSDHFNKSK